MPTTKGDIARWFREGVNQKATHLIVVVDEFDHEDYPVYVGPERDVTSIVQEYSAGMHSMQRIMEVYSLKMDMVGQLAEHRSWHLE